MGAQYGFAADIDVCLPPGGGSCNLPLGDANYCLSSQCGPCTSGQADCDSDSECVAGLVCTHDVGAQYGFAADIDVCLPPGGSCGLPPGDANYCADLNCGPCASGQADCDNDNECIAGLVCTHNVGAQFGFAADIDVCLRPDGGVCPLPLGDASYCAHAECGPCTGGEADCDGNTECVPGLVCTDNVGAQFGFASDIDVCLRPNGSVCSLPLGDANYCLDANCGPCNFGEADCDTNSECAPGLTCVQNVGAQFGFSGDIDVCM